MLTVLAREDLRARPILTERLALVPMDPTDGQDLLDLSAMGVTQLTFASRVTKVLQGTNNTLILRSTPKACVFQ